MLVCLTEFHPGCRHVRTLVVDLDNLLIHSDWTRGRGWRTFKRPGVEDFLREMAQLYEIVVYTQALPTYADPILDRLDPSRFIVYRLYRDSTLYQHGHHVRDLSKLNRDMSKVLFITSDAEACKLHPSNSVVVSWSHHKICLSSNAYLCVPSRLVWFIWTYSCAACYEAVCVAVASLRVRPTVTAD